MTALKMVKHKLENVCAYFKNKVNPKPTSNIVYLQNIQQFNINLIKGMPLENKKQY